MSVNVLEQMMKDRATWVSNNKDKENTEKEHKTRRRSRTGIVCAGIFVVAVLVMFNHISIITALSRLMGRFL